MYRTFQFLWSSPLLSEFLVSSRHVRSVSNCATKAWISWPQNRIRVEGVRLALLQIMHTPWPCIGGVHVARYLKPDSKSGPAITKPKGIQLHRFRASAARCRQLVIIYGSWAKIPSFVLYRYNMPRGERGTFIFRILENSIVREWKETTKKVRISIKILLNNEI